MLITITRKCNEQCTHCMVDAFPDGPHMTMKTFENAVKFALKIHANIIILTGGDVFLHPEVFKMVYLIEKMYKKANLTPSIILESNGWWHKDEDMREKVLRLLNRPSIVQLQISTHKDFYPNYEEICKAFDPHEIMKGDTIAKYNPIHPKISFTKDWQGKDTHLKYMGRAKNILDPKDIKGVPGCLNIVTRAYNLDQNKKLTLGSLMYLCEMTQHMCTPEVNVEGGIQLSEGIGCKVIGNVNNDMRANDILNRILTFVPCNNCLCMKNLTENQAKQLKELQAKYAKN